MKSILNVFFILFFLVGRTIFSMESESSAGQAPEAILYGPSKRKIENLSAGYASDSDSEQTDSEESVSEGSIDDSLEIEPDENYDRLSEDGTFLLCEIIRNEGCEAALNFLKSKDFEQVNVDLEETSGMTPLRQAISYYGKDDYAAKLCIELINRGAEIQKEDKDFLIKNKIISFIPDRVKLKKLVRSKPDKKIYKQKPGTMFKYLILCPVAIGGIFLLYKIFSKQKNNQDLKV